jgi:hypothetical protein
VWFRESQAGASHLERMVFVWEVAENFCGRGTGTVGEPTV